MAPQLIKWIFVANLVLLIVALWRSDALPPPSQLASALLDEPVQTPIQQKAFEAISNGVTYTVQPLHEYDLVGLVVSKHDANTWWDYIHREWNDSLNIVDLCVVWGNNVRSGWRGCLVYAAGAV